MVSFSTDPSLHPQISVASSPWVPVCLWGGLDQHPLGTNETTLSVIWEVWDSIYRPNARVNQFCEWQWGSFRKLCQLSELSLSDFWEQMHCTDGHWSFFISRHMKQALNESTGLLESSHLYHSGWQLEHLGPATSCLLCSGIVLAPISKNFRWYILENYHEGSSSTYVGRSLTVHQARFS